MASFKILNPTESRFESPAKVFAKLKSKVQKESMCGKGGFFTGKEIPLNTREKHGADFQSPKKKAPCTLSEELKENQRFSSYRNEAEALTLSPISSPQKTFDYSCSVISSRPSEEMLPGHDIRGYSRRHGAVLESTAVSQTLCLLNRDHVDQRTHHIRDSEDLYAPNRTPVKKQQEENCAKNVFDTKSGHLKPMSTGNVFSPMRTRLRKRKLVQQEARGLHDCTHNNSSMQDVHVAGFPSDQPEMLHEHRLLPRSAKERCCSVVQGTLPVMSPAKMFAYMKGRESKKQRQEFLNTSKRNLFGGENLHDSEETPLSTLHNVDKTENNAFGRMAYVNLTRLDFPSGTECSEGEASPAAPPEPILLEDPLVLNSPQISIPKTQGPILKRNRWPKQKKFPVENVIYLKNWFLRKNHKGLFVDGIHNEDNIPWNSNIIVDRISHSVLRTVSGRVYILVGKMKMDVAFDFPKWFLRKFTNGFPHNWKTLYEQFLQESKETERNEDERSVRAETKPQTSSKHSVNGHKQKPARTPELRPPTSSSSTKVSRSGRLIKPPLDYWKGGRVILDAHMNVTIHDCYDTSQLETSIRVSPRGSQKPLTARNNWKQSESPKQKRTSRPARKVNAVGKHKEVMVGPYKKPATAIEPTVGMLSSPEKWCGRTRSTRRYPHPATERGVHVNGAPQKQSEPSTQKQETCNINKPSRRKQTATTSPKSPPADKTLSDEEFCSKKKNRMEQVPVEKREKVRNKTKPDHKPSSNQSPEEGRKAQRMRTRETRKHDEAQTQHNESKSTNKCQQAKHLVKSKQSSKKNRPKKASSIIPEDDDKWTDEELAALQEAVSYYPKNIAGYWAKVARMVGTRSAEECHKQHASLRSFHSPARRANKVAAPKPAEEPVISARVGTFKRKQQVRQFLQSQPKENVDDAFSSAYMQNKCFEIPSLCLSDDCDFQMSDLKPQTPKSSHFPEVKTPQCLHITPGMMGSPSANCDDKYIYQLQKRMKKNQFNVFKNSPSKKFTPTPSLRRKMRRCNTDNDSFVVWEMLPENDDALSESGEEEDFYFSDD